MPHSKSGVPGRGMVISHRHSLGWSPVPQPAMPPPGRVCGSPHVAARPLMTPEKGMPGARGKWQQGRAY